MRNNFYDKDKSTGTLEGELKGDTMYEDEALSSEEIWSVREVVFLKKRRDRPKIFKCCEW